MTEKKTLVAIFAHPDDEAFGTGGTLAKYVSEGAEVHLITATLGEAGQIFNPAINWTQPMHLLREKELRGACQIYGLAGLHLLGYVDGQTTIVPQNGAVHKIVQLLRQLKPQVVISFGPEGIYGHYDHLAIHRWATAAVEICADPDWWPEVGEPYQVAKFYHRAMPEEQIEFMKEVSGRSFVPMDGVPFSFLGYPMSKITTIIDVCEYTTAKLEAIRCHASQLDPDNPFLQEDFDPLANPWFCQETYILAKCAPGLSAPQPGQDKETDLFAGVS